MPKKTTKRKKVTTGKKAVVAKKKVAAPKKKATSAKARKFGKKASKEVAKEVLLFIKGEAHSGPKLKKVESREQAVAIGLSKARKKGVKVPKKATPTKKKKK